MIRKPLRPLAPVLFTRKTGGNPDVMEYRNMRERYAMAQEQLLRKTRRRLWMMGAMFFCAFSVIGFQMTALATSDGAEPRVAAHSSQAVASRADILDRNGRILATNMDTYSLYAHPHQLIDTMAAAQGLARIFPDVEVDKMHAILTRGRAFEWIKDSISPEEKQAVYDLGEPGLLFGPRERRLYPNEAIAAHILGGTQFDNEGTHSAEVVGIAGIEKEYDAYLRDPEFGGQPLQLSLDLTVQSALEQVLAGGMKYMNAKGASAVLMDAHSGEIIAMASLPDFDPNRRPRVSLTGRQEDSPLFNRSVQGMYELGSALKLFPIAQAMELGLIDPSTEIDTRGPLKWGRFKINDFHDYGKTMSTSQIFVKSSNIGTARIAMMIGAERQKAFLDSLGFLKSTDIELIEASTGRPQYPSNWSEISTMTISYGHGMSTSQVHLAGAYASIVNGGTLVKPTLLKTEQPVVGPRIVSPEVSVAMRQMLRDVVVKGTAKEAEVPGYFVGGKTGTADKPNPEGKYYEDRVIATFASVFPSHDPKYVMILTLDEPEDRTGPEPRRSAGFTAAPIAGGAIRRIAPLLGLVPDVDYSNQSGVTLVSQ